MTTPPFLLDSAATEGAESILEVYPDVNLKDEKGKATVITISDGIVVAGIALRDKESVQFVITLLQKASENLPERKSNGLEN